VEVGEAKERGKLRGRSRRIGEAIKAWRGAAESRAEEEERPIEKIHPGVRTLHQHTKVKHLINGIGRGFVW
jgi:hypothetical protein